MSTPITKAAATMVWTRIYSSSSSATRSLFWQPRNLPSGASASVTTTPARLFSSSSSRSNDTKSRSSDRDEQISKINPRLTEWIPPDRPLVGDKGFSHLYKKQQAETTTTTLSEEEELKQLEEELKRLEDEELMEPTSTQQQQKHNDPRPKAQPQPMDWLQTRREKLGGGTPAPATVNGMTISYERPGQTLPVLHHTLLTANEIMDYLASLGGIDPNLVEDKVHNQHGDSRMGGLIKGMVFVSAHSCAHVRMLAQSLVDQLKLRKLQEVGVQGAHHGAEGSDDVDETWLVVDCQNYIVHIQDEPTRRMLNLEEWWSNPSPLGGANMEDEDAMDDFVARNPVPPEYGRSGLANWNDTINRLQNKRWTAPHRAVVERPRSRRKRGGKGKGRR